MSKAIEQLADVVSDLWHENKELRNQLGEATAPRPHPDPELHDLRTQVQTLRAMNENQRSQLEAYSKASPMAPEALAVHLQKQQSNINNLTDELNITRVERDRRSAKIARASHELEALARLKLTTHEHEILGKVQEALQ